jgi:hypothetical protein
MLKAVAPRRQLQVPRYFIFHNSDHRYGIKINTLFKKRKNSLGKNVSQIINAVTFFKNEQHTLNFYRMLISFR